MNRIQLSQHATKRSAQRNLSYDEICFIVRHGRRIRRTGVIYCQLQANCIPADLSPQHPFQRLVGATVVLNNAGTSVITVYRNGSAFKKDRRKSKYARQML